MSCHTLPLPLTLPLACQYGELSFIDEFLRQEVDRTTTIQTSTKVKRYATNANGTNNVNHNTNASTSGRRVNENSIPYSSPWYEIESHDAVGLTPLHLATIYQQRPIVEKLLTAETSTGRDGKDGAVVSTLSSSSTFGSLASRLLLTTDLESHWTALHHAFYRGDFLTAHLLRRAGANLNCLDHDGMTPIDLVTNHQAESVRRREANGLGRVATSNAGIGASSISKKMFKASGNELGSTSAFAALAKEERTDEDEKSFNLLYSYGYQSNYTLGYTCDHYQHRPRLLDSCTSSSVVQVLALKQFVFILLSDGTVMSHGQGHSGKLGHEVRETLIQPKRIAALHDITHIAGTDDYICAVNAKGAVFMFGYSMFIDAPGAMAIPNKSNSNTSATNATSRLQPSSHSPPPATRSLDLLSSSSSSSSTSTSANAIVSSSLGVIRYSQLPRRVESLRSLAVRRLFPSTHRLIVLTDSGDLWFIGQSIEDVERWESQPKRFAAPIHEAIIDITNRDEFVAILTVSGSIRLQRRGERKLNKIWLQNYVDVPRNDDRKQFRQLFPLIPPKQHVVSMAWSSPSTSSSSSVDSRQSYNGACVTREGQVFAWKLPQATDGGKVYPRCIGYLVQGLASIRAVDVAVAMRHTCVVTEDGHVYTFGPETIGITRPNEANGTTLTNSSISTSRVSGEDSLTSLPSSVSSNSTLTPNSSVVSLVHTPRRLMHLTQVRQVVLSDQYVMAIVGIRSIPIAPSFTELHGVLEDDNFPRLRHRRHLSNGEMSDDSFIRCEVPSLRLLCQYKLASEMTPLSLLQAYEWACQTSCEHLRHYCTRYLLANMSFYLPSLLALDDVASLVYLQQQYAEHHPLWFSSPQWNQPLQQLSSSYTNDNHLNQHHASSLLTSTSTSVSSSSSPFLFPSAFSSLSQSTLHHPPPTGSPTVVDTEERVDAIKLRRRAVVKKLGQIAGIMNNETTPSHVRTKLSHPLDAAQREKIAQRDRYEKELEELERELSALCQRGSVAANELWEKLHPTPTSTSAPSSSPPAPTPSTSTNITDSSTSSFSSSSSIEHLPASDTDTASLLLPTDPSAATPSSSASSSSSSSRVASALFDRPVRPLNQSSHHEKTNQTPLSLSSSTKFKGTQNDRSTAQPSSSSTTTTATLTSSPLSSPSPTRPIVTPTMSPVLATTANTAPMSAGKWKNATQTSNLTPLHATINTTAATTGTASMSVSSSSSLHSPVILPTSSLAEIQKEEEAKAKLLDAKSRKMPRPSSSSSTSISSSSIISSSISGKGWGAAPTNQMSTPVLVSTPVISTLNSHDRDSMNDFPSLAAVASHSPPLKPTRNGSMGKLSSPLVRPSSNVAISGSAPSSSTSSSSFGQSHTSQPGVFSLADFMPTLPSKLKVASTPVKTWNIPTVNNHVSANVAATTSANTTTAAASSVDPNMSASSKDGKKRSKSHHGKSQHPSASASATVDPSPSSTVTATPSFLSIQAAEAARFYGPASAFKTQRELDLEFEYCQASLGGTSRPAWNIAPSALGSSGLTLLDVQQQEQAALLQAAARERQREEKAARKKAKQAEAKQREIEAAQLAKALKQTKLEARAAGATSKEEQVPTNNNHHNNNNNNGKQKSHQRPKSGKTKHNGSHQHNHPSNSANCEDSNSHPHVDDSSNTAANPSSNSVHPSTSQSGHPKSARSRKTHSNHSNDSTVTPNHTTNSNPNLNPDSNSNLLNGVRDNSAQKSSRPRGPPQSTRQHTKNQPTNQSAQHQQQRQAAPANGTPAGSQ